MALQHLGQVFQLGDLGGVLHCPPHHPECSESREGGEQGTAQKNREGFTEASERMRRDFGQHVPLSYSAYGLLLPGGPGRVCCGAVERM